MSTTPPPATPDAVSWWRRLFQPPRRAWLLGIPVGALLFFVLGIAFFGGAAAVLEASSSTRFCTSACHEMTAFSVPEWQASTHYKNAAGFQAGCPDCHVPRPEIPRLVRKARALGEVWGHLTGSIATQAKFDASKVAMARDTWAEMKANDSRECRSCHNVATMDLSAQEHSAQIKHARMKTSGETCIDCHKGIVHSVPPGADTSS